MDDATSGATASGLRSDYGTGDLVAGVLAALVDAGIDPEAPTVADLVSLDVLGPPAADLVVRLADRARVDAGTEVLDIGSGIGTAARLLAERGARVTALDLVADVCALARELAERTGTADRLQVRQGNATDLRFAPGSFDVVWIAHVAVLVEDKHALFTEARRVLRPGGRVAVLEPVAGDGAESGPLPLPQPWAGRPGESYLETAKVTKRLLEATGSRIVHEEDVGVALARDLELLVAAGRRGPSPAAYFGDVDPRLANYVAALRSGRVRTVLLVAEAI